LKPLSIIAILLVLLCKISEPLVMSLRYTAAETSFVPDIMDNEGQIELKIYAPLPYGSNWENNDPTQELFQKDDNFYNIVARRFQNDTFYLKIQPNLNARARFDALSSVINQALLQKTQQKQSTSNDIKFSLEDLIKVFAPPTSPTIVHFDSELKIGYQPTVCCYTFFLPKGSSPIFAPPPERV
jgi:hypothetical protein